MSTYDPYHRGRRYKSNAAVFNQLHNERLWSKYQERDRPHLAALNKLIEQFKVESFKAKL